MNGHPDIDTNEATEHLKNILNVGKAEPVKSLAMESGDTSSENANTFQRIDLTGNDGSIGIYGTDVTVYPSPLKQTPSSCSNIIIYNVVDYGWEHKYHLGCLVAVHLSRIYIAYTLKGPTANGYVRVIKHATSNHLLLRGFRGSVKDISFAHSLSRILLGCIDEMGELYIYEILDEEPRLKGRLYLHITRPNSTGPSNHHRIVWCPYVPEDTMGNNIDQEEARLTSLLIATSDEKAEVWLIDAVVKAGHQVDLSVEEVTTGMKSICEHKKPITAAAFSPDAIALATASLDGEVKFFQISAMDSEGPPRCVHKWIPHDGKPVSSLFFLDNHKSYTPDVQFWKFAVTGANYNEELKIWSCQTWTCLQTIRMVPYDADIGPQYFKADIDLSGEYLFLSDLSRVMFYVFKISEDPSPTRPAVCSLTEFPVKFPVLSFSIVDVVPHKSKVPFHEKNSADGDDEDEDDDEEDDDKEEVVNDVTEKNTAYRIKLYWVNTKSFQFCKIFYSPKASSPLHSIGSLSSSQDSFAYKDGLSDISTDVQEQTNLASCEVDMNSNKTIAASPNMNTVLSSPSVALTSASVASLVPLRSPGYQDCDEVLLTPKDFAMSPHTSLNTSGPYKLTALQETSDHSIPVESTEGDDLSGVTPEQNSHPRRKSSQHSSTSSPSREVAEILSPNQILDQDSGLISPKPKEDIILTPQLDVHSNVICASPVLNQPQDYLSDAWPRAPDPPKEYKVSVSPGSDGDMHRQHLPLEDEGSTRRTLHGLNDAAVIPPEVVPNDGVPTSLMQRIDRSMEALSLKLSSITEALHCQSQAIQFIQREVQHLKQEQKYAENNVQNYSDLENTITKKVERIVSENSLSDYTRLENLLNKHGDCNQQRIDHQTATVSQNVVVSVNKQLDKVIKQELQNSVVPQMTKYLQNLIENFQGEVLQKLNSTDSALKECLGKHLKSKAFSENLAQSAAIILQQSVQLACKEVFQNHVVSSLDKCCQLLFSQLNEVFMQGVQEYTEKLDKYHQLTIANQEAATARFQEVTHTLIADAQNLFSKLSEKSQADAALLNRQHDLLLSKVRQVVHETVQRAMTDNASSIAAAVRSQASTPAPQSESQISPQQLLHLARQGQINEAFQKALSAVDLKLVLMLCENVSVDQVFGPECPPLAQHVLLSLINQLSGDLSEKTEIKVRYIEDAITSLDRNDPVTKEHLGRVANSLEQRALAFLKHYPAHRMARNVKRILMSIESFGLK